MFTNLRLIVMAFEMYGLQISSITGIKYAIVNALSFLLQLTKRQ